MPTAADALIAARMLQDAARQLLALDVDALALLHTHPGRMPAATADLHALANDAIDAGRRHGIEGVDRVVLVVDVLTTSEEVTFTPWTDGGAVGYTVARPEVDDQVECVLLNPSTATGEGEGTGNVFLYAGTGPAEIHGADALTHIAFFEQS